MLWMTVYLWKSGGRAKSIEAEWCSNALWWALGNYAYFTLTSRNLRVKINNVEEIISPKYYYIQLTGWTTDPDHRCTPENAFSWKLCKDIILWYATWYFVSWAYDPDLNIQKYDTINVSNTCRHWKPYLWFYWSWGNYTWDIEFIRMNKWFTPREVKAEMVFFLKDNGWTTENDTKLLTWDIIVVLCSDESCACTNEWCWRKQIGKRQVDARSQTISFKKCRYYFDGENDNICKTREDCRVYSGSDPTVCMSY